MRQPRNKEEMCLCIDKSQRGKGDNPSVDTGATCYNLRIAAAAKNCLNLDKVAKTNVAFENALISGGKNDKCRITHVVSDVRRFELAQSCALGYELSGHHHIFRSFGNVPTETINLRLTRTLGEFCDTSSEKESS